MNSKRGIDKFSDKIHNKSFLFPPLHIYHAKNRKEQPLSCRFRHRSKEGYCDKIHYQKEVLFCFIDYISIYQGKKTEKTTNNLIGYCNMSLGTIS